MFFFAIFEWQLLIGPTVHLGSTNRLHNKSGMLFITFGLVL